MDRESLISMAKEVWSAEDVYIGPNHESLEQFAALVAAHEREACAKVCEWLGTATNGIYERNMECAAAIRTRDAT
jgi:hypothetical protein